jgi:hypothetical protein
MRAVELLFAVGWAAFWLYWLLSAFTAKRSKVAWSHELLIRLVIVVCAIVLLRLGVLRGGDLTTDPVRAASGLVLLVLGLGSALWARVHMGRNWGGPMSRKDDTELVTRGPYRLVRHPIYGQSLPPLDLGTTCLSRRSCMDSPFRRFSGNDGGQPWMSQFSRRPPGWIAEFSTFRWVVARAHLTGNRKPDDRCDLTTSG